MTTTRPLIDPTPYLEPLSEHVRFVCNLPDPDAPKCLRACPPESDLWEHGDVTLCMSPPGNHAHHVGLSLRPTAGDGPVSATSVTWVEPPRALGTIRPASS